MSTLLSLAQKQLGAAYQALIAEIKDFVGALPAQADLDMRKIGEWALTRLGEQQKKIAKADDLVQLIRLVYTLQDVTGAWTLYEEAWENRVRLPLAPPEPTEGRALRQQAIQTGEILVKKLYEPARVAQLNLELPPRSIIIVPFMSRLYTGGIDTPVPYIVTPRWGYIHPWNWTGYAHEAGHHVFRNVQGFSDELKVNLVHHLLAQGRNYSTVCLWYNWLEEIFADVFGLLQIGPAFARTQQYVALPALPRSVITTLDKNADPRAILLQAHDFTHPISYLRVDLARQVLEITGLANQNTLDQLQSRWDEFFAGFRGQTDHLQVKTFVLNDDGSAKMASRKKKTELLRTIGGQVLRLILETPLYSLAAQDGTPRTVRQVFSRDLRPEEEIGAAGLDSPAALPDDLGDIRDVVSWAENQFDQIREDEVRRFTEISRQVVNRFNPALYERKKRSA